MVDPRRNRPATEEPKKAAVDPKHVRIALVAVAALAVGIFVWLLIEAVGEEQEAERWDAYVALRDANDVPLAGWRASSNVYLANRDKLIRALENFLAEYEDEDDTLAAHVHWQIATALADQVLSMHNVPVYQRRAEYWERAAEHVRAIRDEHPDFPLNWSTFAPQQPSFPSMTRKFLQWIEANRSWEEEHLLEEVEPEGEHLVLVRTNRGDVRFRLYEAQAPVWTEAFIDRALSGYYDGTALFEKLDRGDAAYAPGEHTIRGGAAYTAGAKPYDPEGHLEFAGAEHGGGHLPEPTRNRVLFTRGIVSAWHPETDEYDRPEELLFVVRRSPRLDYAYTPVGKVTDEASLATLDRIYEGATWRDDPEVTRDTGELRDILGYFQVPVTIEKVLLYRDGALVRPPESMEVLDRKAEVLDGEARLDSVEADRYLAPTPEKPPSLPPEHPDDVGDGGSEENDGDTEDGGGSENGGDD